MSRRDVELVIRARDQASKTTETVADALRALDAAQKKAADGADDTGAMLTRLGASLTQLQAKATALTGLGKVANNLRDAQRAVDRLDDTVRGSADDQARLTAQNQRLGQTLADLKGKTQAASAELNRRRAAINRAAADNERYARSIRQIQDRLGERNALNLGSGGRVDLDTGRLEAALTRLRQVQTQAQQQISSNEAALPVLEGKLKEYASAINVAEVAQAKLNKQIDRGAATLNEQRAQLTQGRTAQQGLAAEAQRLGAALGGVEISQEGIRTASTATASAIDLVTRALKEQRTAATQAGQFRAQTESRQPAEVRAVAEFARQRVETEQLREAFVAARAEANRLGQAMANTAAPTAELQAQMVAARAASVQAGVAYRQAAERTGQLAESLNRAQISARVAAEAQREAARAAQFVEDTGLRARASLQQLTGAFLRAGSAADKLSFSWTRTGNASRQALSLYQRFRGEVLSLTAAAIGLYGAFDQLSLVVDSFRTLEAAQSRLGAVFDQDFEQVGRELRFLEREAERLGIGFDVLSQEYSKFVVAANSSNFALDTTRQLFLSVAEAGRVNKLRVAELEGIFLALTQMISKGTVSSEELRRQLGDRLPGAFVLFAEALGVTTAELDKMLRQGEVLANEETLIKFARQLNESFGGQLEDSLGTATTQLERFRNEIFQARLLIAQSGFIEELTEGVVKLTEALRSDAGQAFFQNLGRFLGEAISGFTDLVELFVEFNEVLVAVAAIFAGRALAGALANFLGGLPRAFTVLRTGVADVNRMQVALGRLGIAANLAGGRMTLFGRSVGGVFVRAIGTASIALRTFVSAIGGLPALLASIAVFAAIDYFTSVETATDRMNRALDTTEGVLTRVKDAFAESKTEAEAFAKVQERITKTELDSALRQAEAALVEARREVTVPTVPLNPFEVIAGVGSDARRELDAIVKAFQEGGQSVDEFRREIDRFARTRNVDASIFGDLFDQLDTAESAEEAVEKVRVALAAFEQQLTDADRAMLPLADTTDGLGQGFRDAATDVEAFDKSLRELAKFVPELKEELALRAQFDEISEAAQEGLAAAGNDRNRRFAVTSAAARARAALRNGPETEIIRDLAREVGVTVDALQALIAREGGVSTRARNLPGENFATIGIGDTPRSFSGRNPVAGDVITRQQAISDFATNIRGFAGMVDELVTVPITEAMRAALISFQFNTGGLGSARGRRLILDPLNAGQYSAVPQGIIDYREGLNRVDPVNREGLRNRSQFEADDFLADGLPIAEIRAEAQRELGRRIEANAELLADLADEEIVRAFETSIAGLPEREQQVRRAQFDAQRRATEAQVTLEQRVLDTIRAQVEAQYDAAEAAELIREQTEARDALERDISQQERDRSFEIGLIGLPETEQEVLRAQREILDQAREAGATVSQEQLDTIRSQITETARRNKLEEANTELLRAQTEFRERQADTDADRAFETRIAGLDPREQAIQRAQYAEIRAAAEAGLTVDEARLNTIRQQEGALYDLVNAERLRAEQIAEIDKNINLLEERRSLLIEQIEYEREQGNTQAEVELQEVLSSVNDQLREAITRAIAMYEAMGGPEAQNAILTLRNLQNQLDVTAERATLTGEQVANTFASTMTQAIRGFFDGLREGQSTISALGDAFREFAANFLVRLGEMITQAVLFSTVMAGLRAVGLGGTILPGVFHAGGIVGHGAPRRTVDPAVFAGALRYHSGGMPGLRQSEVPAILQKGEEVLSRDDPRNALNGGAQPQGQSVRVINAVDGTDVLDAALSSPEGERVLLNRIRSNRGKYRSALGVS